MPGNVTVSCALAEVLREYLRRNRLHAPELIHVLDAFSLHQRMPVELLVEQFVRIQHLHPVPALGLRIGRCAEPENFGVVGYLAASCSSLGQALARYHRFQTLLASDLNIQVEQRAEYICFRWKHDETQLHPLTSEFGVAVFLNLYQALIGQAVPPTLVEFPHGPPEQPAIYEVLLGCPVRFHAPAIGLQIPTSLLAMRIASSDPYMRDLLDRQAAALLMPQLKPGVFLTALHEHIAAALQDGEPTADRLARQMDYTLRSFYRELANHGLRYRAVLSDVRLKLARMYLADPRLAAAEIALLLGYSEQSAFSRAFRGWTGSTPGAYRKSLERERARPS
ncbi:AraC family transcriptional regulator ligand-binding domain-containing protein [Allohahella sp. A8]|uniref:AraC family transcriptional regulator n=1 Tax=Allohahella sp. A8 TaxID=3141461 RepID=UPI000C0AF9C8|nr:AraC family transcriptional regulator [Hahellaceae bacterium]|tara:strand:+ start:55734 stop:56744 length:1011 start_codon:yes stop_codon:yes gene_type:complete